MSNIRREKKNKGLKVLAIVVIIAALVACSVHVAKRIIVKKVAEYAVQKAADTVLSNASDSLSDEQIVKLKNLYNNMDHEDKAAVEKIVADKVTPQLVSEASQYVAQKDTASLKKLAEENLTKEDKTVLENLYKKYSGEINK
jgi:hypothetical protein